MSGKSRDRRGSGPLWFVMLVLVLFALYSVAVAVAGQDDCGGGAKSWQFFPPAWECEGRLPGYG